MPSQLSPSGPETDERTAPDEPVAASDEHGFDRHRSPQPAGSTPTAAGPGSRRAGPYLLAGGAYLVVSLILWWHVLPHPRSVTTCGCGDGALNIWLINWPAYALRHGLNPFYSSKLFVPVGINTTNWFPGLGIVTAPITWLFGPVASLNLIDLLSPPLSALAMFWLLRRWVTWWPAAFIGGLFFGYSPFLLFNLALAHPNLSLLAAIPLIIGLVDDLMFRHRFRPNRVGALLGVLVALQFFVGVEVLLLLALFGVLVLGVVGVRSLVRHGSLPRKAITDAAVPMATAAGVAMVLLAYPLWFFVAGPAHLVGRTWSDAPSGTVANTPATLVNGFTGTPLTGVMHLFGGYQGPELPSPGFLGLGVIAVVVSGSVIWRRDPVVRFFGLSGLVAVVLSLGVGNGYWAPWRIFTHLPVVNDVTPVNLTAIIDTCAAIVLAMIVERARQAVAPRRAARLDGDRRIAGRLGNLTGAMVAVVALTPVLVAMWPNIPMTVRPVASPAWFTTVAPHLTGHVVVLPYPGALGGIQSSMAWQATGGMTFSMVGGGGPGIVASRAGKEGPGFDLLNRAALSLYPPPLPTGTNLATIRKAVSGWGVTTVVVPDQPGLPSYDKGRGAAYAVGLFTASLGSAPRWQANAWVWDTGHAGPPIPVPAAAFAACTSLAGSSIGGSAVASCILAHR